MRLLIPNTTQVPNIFLDKMMAILPPAPFKVAMAVARFTYGFQRRSDRISLSQLARITGLKRRATIYAVQYLGRLLNIKSGGLGRVNEYSLNLEITEEQFQELATRKVKSSAPECTGAFSQPKLVHQGAPFQTNISKPMYTHKTQNPPDSGNKKEGGGDPDFERAWAAYPRRAGGNPKKKAAAQWNARIRAGVAAVDLVAGVERYARFVRATGKERTEYVKQAATFFGPDEHWQESWEAPARPTHVAASGGFVG